MTMIMKKKKKKNPKTHCQKQDHQNVNTGYL